MFSRKAIFEPMEFMEEPEKGIVWNFQVGSVEVPHAVNVILTSDAFRRPIVAMSIQRPKKKRNSLKFFVTLKKDQVPGVEK